MYVCLIELTGEGTALLLLSVIVGGAVVKKPRRHGTRIDGWAKKYYYSVVAITQASIATQAASVTTTLTTSSSVMNAATSLFMLMLMSCYAILLWWSKKFIKDPSRHKIVASVFLVPRKALRIGMVPYIIDRVLHLGVLRLRTSEYHHHFFYHSLLTKCIRSIVVTNTNTSPKINEIFSFSSSGSSSIISDGNCARSCCHFTTRKRGGLDLRQSSKLS